MTDKSSFKVIIVGGSIGGLTLAHCLSRANIDYVVLEARPEIAPQVGAGIGISPNGGRILDQLGLFDTINAQTVPMELFHYRESDGVRYSSSDIFQAIRKRFGYPCIFPARQAVLQVLADNLKEKDRIHLGQRIVKIEYSDKGAIVFTKDGSEYAGDLVVGADGVHSSVRSEMWRHADLLKPGFISTEEKKGMVAEYSCLWGLSNPTPGMKEGHAELTLNNGFSVLCMAEKNGRIFWFVTHKMGKKYTWPDAPRFSKEDAEKYADTLKDYKLLENTTFGDLWGNRTTFNMTVLDENVFQHWYFGRIVCLGDSVHKMTPNLGQGGNCAIESAAALANNLHNLVNEIKSHTPTTNELNAYLSEYQQSNKDRISGINFVSGIVTRAQARDGLYHKIMSQYVYKVIDDNAFNLNSDMMVAAAKIDYLPLPERSINGWMPFDKNLGIMKKPQSSRRMLQAAPFLVFFAVALSSIPVAEFLNGTRELIRQVSTAGAWPVNGGAFAIKDTYLGIPWIDSLVKQFVIRFPANLPGLDNLQRLQMISTIADLIPLHTIWTIESWRSGNVQLLTNLSMLFALASQKFSLGVIAPIYFFHHFVRTSYHNYASIDMRVIQSKYAWPLIPTVITTMILPAILLFGPFDFTPDTYQTIIAAWQFFPLSFSLLHQALAKLIPETEHEKSNPGVDIPILQRTYIFVGLVSASVHLYIRSFGLSGYEVFLAGARDPFSAVGSAIEGIGRSASLSYLLGFGSSLLWAVMTINDLKKAGRTDASLVKIMSLLVAGTALFGPGAVLAVFWMWREDILSKRRTGRETVNPL